MMLSETTTLSDSNYSRLLSVNTDIIDWNRRIGGNDLTPRRIPLVSGCFPMCCRLYSFREIFSVLASPMSCAAAVGCILPPGFKRFAGIVQGQKHVLI